MTGVYLILAAPIAGGVCGAVWAVVNMWRESKSIESDSSNVDLGNIVDIVGDLE